MLIYLDLLFILNLWIDFLLLLVTNIILKRKIVFVRIIISSFIGGLSTFAIFIDRKELLMIMKVIICIVMQVIANGFKNIKYTIENTIYFYLSSIILAGTAYLFGIDKFGFKDNFILLFILSPIVLLIVKIYIKKIEFEYQERYNVTIVYNNHKYYFNAFLDTGNKIYDPYKKRPISLIFSRKIKFNYKDGILVPIETANSNSILKCVIVDKMIIVVKVINNPLIGISDKKFNIDDINMILHKDIIGGIK